MDKAISSSSALLLRQHDSPAHPGDPSDSPSGAEPEVLHPLAALPLLQRLCIRGVVVPTAWGGLVKQVAVLRSQLQQLELEQVYLPEPEQLEELLQLLPGLKGLALEASPRSKKLQVTREI